MFLLRTGHKAVCIFNGISELSVQCRFLKVQGNSMAVKKVHGNIVSDSKPESGSSELQVEVGDFITVHGKKVYVVLDITLTGIHMQAL
jgi:hypothetical protein